MTASATFSRMKTAFLGLGAIGRPMAKCIAAAGHPLAVWNRTPERATELTASIKARVAKHPADAVRAAEVVVTCLPNSPDAERLLDGPAAILRAITPYAVL